jgi:hypothetical protein
MLLYHAATGMDTTLSLLCNTLLVFATLELIERKRDRFVWWTVAAGYLAFAARPDNLICAALFPPLCILLLGGSKRARVGGRVPGRPAGCACR